MRVLVPLANGVEEMEAVILVDVLRRAEWDVVTASVSGTPVTASRGLRIIPDAAWNAVQAEKFDMLAIPGGAEGVDRLCGHKDVLAAARDFASKGKWLAAICAGPLVLESAGVLRGRMVTCHPAAVPRLRSATRSEERVVVDGRLVTSQGPGTAMEWALTLVRLVDGPVKADLLAQKMIVSPAGAVSRPQA